MRSLKVRGRDRISTPLGFCLNLNKLHRLNLLPNRTKKSIIARFKQSAETQSMTHDAIRTEALRILEILISMPFEECFPLRKEFDVLPARPGLYAVKHKEEGILYIGKALNVRNRFMGGHKALYYAYLDRLDPDDVRIAVVTLTYNQRLRALDLEAFMLQVAKPRYNSRIRQSQD